MKAKHKLLNDFQYISPDKKIFVLKSGTILEEYNYKVKGEVIPVDRDIVDNNPEFFEVVDWKAELMSFMRVNKMPQPAQLGKKLIPFIEEMVLSSVAPMTVVVDQAKVRLLEEKDTELFRKDKVLEKKYIEIKSLEDITKDKFDRAERRDIETKTEQTQQNQRAERLDAKAQELIEKANDLEQKESRLREEENRIDLMVLSTAEKADSKYKEMMDKIEDSLKDIESREKQLDKREADIFKRESEDSDSRIKSTIREFFDFSGPITNNPADNPAYQKDPMQYNTKLTEMVVRLYAFL
jgi:hypothetical protein